MTFWGKIVFLSLFWFCCGAIRFSQSLIVSQFTLLAAAKRFGVAGRLSKERELWALHPSILLRMSGFKFIVPKQNSSLLLSHQIE
jgi:hypothetical protein